MNDLSRRSTTEPVLEALLDARAVELEQLDGLTDA